MKKLVLMCLMITAMFAYEDDGIFSYFYSEGDIPREDGTTFRENLSPSFDCSKKNLNIAERAICDSKYYSLSVFYSYSNNYSDRALFDIEGSNPSLIYLDNLFSSFYQLIMQHTPKDKQQELKEIAKKAMQYRDQYAAECGKNRNGKVIFAGVPRDLCIVEEVEKMYILGIDSLIDFLSENNQKLLDNTLAKYAESIDIMYEGDQVNTDKFNTVERLLDMLYIDKIIDETGKLIIKVDSNDTK